MLTDRELDHLIDAALSSYSATAARPGIEQRILAHALAEQPRRRRFLWAWGLVVPAAACVIMLALFAGRHAFHQGALEATATTAPAPRVGSPHDTTATNAPPMPRKRLHSREALTAPPAAPEALPRQEVFPSPSPLTPEERAAIALTREPLQMAHQLDTAEVEITPIHIAGLQIKPIAPPDGDLPGSLATESSRNNQKP